MDSFSIRQRKAPRETIIDRHAAGIPSAIEYQRALGEGKIDPDVAAAHRWLDSFLPEDADLQWRRMMRASGDRGKNIATVLHSPLGLGAQATPNTVIPGSPMPVYSGDHRGYRPPAVAQHSDVESARPPADSRLNPPPLQSPRAQSAPAAPQRYTTANRPSLFGPLEARRDWALAKVRELETIAADPNRSQRDRDSARRGARLITRDIANYQGMPLAQADLDAEANPLLTRMDAWAQQQAPLRTAAVKAASGEGSKGGGLLLPTSPFTMGASTAPQLTFEERQKENHLLVASRPKRKSPFSNEVQLDGGVKYDVHGQAMVKGALLADYAHDDGGVPKLTASDKVIIPDAAGQYYSNEMGVRRDSNQPALVSLYEMGHHIAVNALNPDALNRIKDAARDTRAWELIQKHCPQDKLSYWTDADEVFCRVYAQWVIQKAKDIEGINEINYLLGMPTTCFVQWQSSDFAGVAKAMEIEFKKIGWLK